MRQFRDWGRDCWCDTGKDNTCGKRFGWKIGDLPAGYDHKYIYSQMGFNLKLTDFQAAIGVAQMEKLPGFIKKRQENYRSLYTFFKQYPQYFQLMSVNKLNDTSYFGFPLLVRTNPYFTRNDLTKYLEENGIGTRNIFSGNILRHPAYSTVKKKYRVVGKQENADAIMNSAFWLGVWPGIKKEDIVYMKKTISKFLHVRALAHLRGV